MTPRVADAILGKVARQQNDLFRRVREGTLDPEQVSRGLQLIIEGRSLIGGVFTSVGRQLELVREWNSQRGWGFTDQDFLNLGEPPAWPESKLVAVVLDVQLETIQKTFEEAWARIVSQKPNSHRWEEMKTDKDHLRLYPGCRHRRQLSWRIIDLGANQDKSPEYIQKQVNPEVLPHSAGLWAAALHPKWVRAMDLDAVPFVNIVGYQFFEPAGRPWTNMLLLSGSVSTEAVRLNTGNGYHPHRGWAVPVFLEFCPSPERVDEWLESDGSNFGMEEHISSCRSCQVGVAALALLSEGDKIITHERMNAKLATVGLARGTGE